MCHCIHVEIRGQRLRLGPQGINSVAMLGDKYPYTLSYLADPGLFLMCVLKTIMSSFLVICRMKSLVIQDLLKTRLWGCQLSLHLFCKVPRGQPAPPS